MKKKIDFMRIHRSARIVSTNRVCLRMCILTNTYETGSCVEEIVRLFTRPIKCGQTIVFARKAIDLIRIHSVQCILLCSPSSMKNNTNTNAKKCVFVKL